MQVAEPSPLATRAAETAQTAAQPLRTEHSRGDHGLHEDVRLLGRLLGETVREHEGQEAFERIEAIRRLSIAASRNEHEAEAKLDSLLRRLTAREALSVIRAFSYFLHLGNIAEDLHPLQQRARAEASGENAGSEPSLAKSFAKLRKASVGAGKIAQALARAWISPVLTAHPTEVRRKCLLDAEHAVFSLLAEREHLRAKSELNSKRGEALGARLAALADRAAAPCAPFGARRDREHAELLSLDLSD